ncbi:hypothetical protein ACFLTD_04080 [Elusimicrobiota bacterium]
MKKIIALTTIIAGFVSVAFAGEIVQQWEDFPSNCFLDGSFQSPSLAKGSVVTVYDSKGNKERLTSDGKRLPALNKVATDNSVTGQKKNTAGNTVYNNNNYRKTKKARGGTGSGSKIRIEGANPLRDSTGRVIGEYEINPKTGMLQTETYFAESMTSEEYQKMKMNGQADSIEIVKKYIYDDNASLSQVIAYSHKTDSGSMDQ